MSLNILISQPNLYDRKVFMPLVFLCLKTYVDKRDDVEPVNWLDPLFRNTDVDTMLQDVDTKNVDILGISCYDWNWQLNLEIAKRIKYEEYYRSILFCFGLLPTSKWSKDFTRWAKTYCKVQYFAFGNW